MTTTTIQPLPTTEPVRTPHPLRKLFSSIPAALCTLWVVFIVIASMTAPLWVPYSPVHQDYSAVLSPPSAAHWLGTDELGRDLLSRIFTAGGPALGTSLITVAVALLVSIPLALLAAQAGARAEGPINRATEIVMSVPATVIMLVIIGAVGTNVPVVMAILGILISAGIYRVVVGQAKSVQTQLFIDAAKVDGVHPLRISLRHVFPALLTTLLVQAALIFAIGLMIQAGLAFIGFGPPLPQPSWGGMIQSASQHVYDAPWMMVPTGAVLALTVVSINGLADLFAGDEAAPSSTVRRPQKSKAVGSAPVESDASGDGRLQVTGLSVSLESGQALVTDVSFAVPRGRIVGLVGESGCGKTLTALSLMSLLPPGVQVSAGSIIWGGRDLTSLSETEMMGVRGREIAFIAQDPMRALDPMFTVGYQLVGALRRLRGLSRNQAQARAAELLEQVGIHDVPLVLRSYAHQISGGMAQRVAIALALSGDPQLIVADEPTTALDVTVQANILDLLRDIAADRGMSVVFVTHDLGVVADICDEVVVMYAGEVIEHGSARDVLETPEHPYTSALVSADPHSVQHGESTRLATIPGHVPLPKDWPTGCRFIDRCPFAAEACKRPVPVLDRTMSSGEVRCIRTDIRPLRSAIRTHSESASREVSEQAI